MLHEGTASHTSENGNETSDVWVTRNNHKSETVEGSVAIVGGVALAIGGISGFTMLAGSSADVMLGVLIAVLGLSLLLRGKEVVTVDAGRRLITLEDGLFGHRVREIDFNDVVGTEVGEIDGEGQRSDYFVRLRLQNGETLAMYLGHFEGRDSEHAMDQRRLRLIEMLRLGGRNL